MQSITNAAPIHISNNAIFNPRLNSPFQRSNSKAHPEFVLIQGHGKILNRVVLRARGKWRCSAAEQPQQQGQKQRPPKQKRNRSDEESGIDPVGFLTKYGITHKAFAQFLRERLSSARLKFHFFFGSTVFDVLEL